MARHAWLRGYRVFKLKIGKDAELVSGFAAIRALRERFGKEIELRIDPNGAWPEDKVAELLAQLTEFEPELVEEPCPFASLLKLTESPVPLALDESLIDPAALSSVIPHCERLKLRAVVVKPALLGLFRALELCLAAEEVGLDVIVTHLFDGPVGHASAMSLALAMGSPERAHGLAPHPGLLLSPNRRIRGLGQGLLLHDAAPGLPLIEVKPC
jgi:L-alanine-DL-glutamate epimerase-like enolase superfamily enzyme